MIQKGGLSYESSLDVTDNSEKGLKLIDFLQEVHHRLVHAESIRQRSAKEVKYIDCAKPGFGKCKMEYIVDYMVMNSIKEYYWW